MRGIYANPGDDSGKLTKKEVNDDRRIYLTSNSDGENNITQRD